MDYNPNVVDEYAKHLSVVNQSNAVLATEDIYNEQGVLLIRKGCPISEKLAAKVVCHKLTRPLEQSVNLESVLDAGRLYRHFQDFLNRFGDCALIHRELNLDSILKTQCTEYYRYPLLTQKLTVLQHQREEDLQKSLFCAWLALAIAFQMKLSDDQQRDVFLAGLMHDVGMLHIPQTTLNKTGSLTAEEWRAIQSHPLIGQVFLKSVPGLSPAVAQATLEHHERMDGTGYPAGRFADQLSLEGQVVAIADAICAIRMNRFAGENRSLRDMLPILQLNCQLYNQDCYRCAAALIRLLPPRKELRCDQEMKHFVEQRLEIHQLLSNWFETVPLVVDLLPEESDQRVIRSASYLVRNIWFAVASSGLLSSSLGQWMSKVEDKHLEHYYPSMDEISIMQDEVLWQLRQLMKALRALCEHRHGVPEAVLGNLSKMLDTMEGWNQQL